MKTSVLIVGLLACSVSFVFAQAPAVDAKPLPLTLTPPKDAPPVVAAWTASAGVIRISRTASAMASGIDVE